METERITVKEIARLAGVSIGTIDRVLHERGGVSPETKERIDGIVASLGYEPNLLARQLSLNKTYTFRALLPRADQDSGYWSLCLAGLRRAERELLAPYRARLRVDEFDRYDRKAYRRMLAEVVAHPCDGLLFAPALPEELLPALERLSAGAAGDCDRPPPYAFFDSEVEGSSPVASIAQDPLRGGRLAGRLMTLLAAPAGRLVALSAHAGDRHIARRVDAFKSWFAESDGPRREVESRECRDLESPEERESFLSGLFEGKSGISGALVANSSGHLVGDWLASRGLKAGCAIVSWDLVPANARALDEGRIDCVLSQRPAEQAREALRRLFNSVLYGADAAEAAAAIPLDVYFRENIPDGADARAGPMADAGPMAGEGPAFQERS
jgi:LacI family transcriptional regulator